MINQHFYIARLIARYLSDEIGEEEQAVLTRWRNESPENERLFQEICKEENIKQNMQKRQTFHAEDGWEGVQRKIQRHRFRNRILNICKYAAIFIFPVAIATVAIYKSGNEPQPLSQATEQIVPGGKKAVLILDNGEAIDLKSTSGVQLKEKDGTVIQVDSTALNYQQAPARTSEKLAYNKVNVPRGGEYQLTLSDGSKVQLNSMSSIRFPVQFAQDCRLVELEGEAYFEVAKDKEKPFIVKANGINVQALGTSFNIRAHKDDKSVAVILISGKVKVDDGRHEAYMKPNERLVCNLTNGQFEKSELHPNASNLLWRSNELALYGESFEEICTMLTRMYNCKFIFKNEKAKQYTYHGIIKNGSLNNVLEYISQAGGINYKIESDNTIIIY